MIVLLIGSIVVAHIRRTAADLRVSARATGTPTAGTPSERDARGRAQTFVGEGSWVLSSLPDCFDERARSRGPQTSMATHVPAPALRLTAATTFRSGPCTVVVGEHDVLVRRGADRLHVPPDAALYRTPEGLTLVSTRAGKTEIRVYALPGSN